MSQISFSDRWVLVTGASSGLGRAIALELALSERARVIAVARREDRLQELCAEIAAAGGPEAHPLVADLLAEGAPARVLAAAQEVAAGALFGLVNNAGVTWYGSFAAMPQEQISRILRLNIQATMELTAAFVQVVTAAGAAVTGGNRAAILTITSLGAFVPVPYQSVYAASKHAVQAFSESIALELRRSGIVVTAVGPGGVETEMIARAGLDRKFSSGALAAPQTVARAAVRAWKRRRIRSVPGVGNKLAAAVVRILPARLVASVSESLFRP